MIRTTVLATSILLLFAIQSPATVQITTTSQPTPGLPDYLTYTYTAVSTDPIVVFDFWGDGSTDPATGKGFFGTLNQVVLFGGALPTIFQDYNPVFPAVGADPLQDSQFLVKSLDVFVPPGLVRENANLLQGVWAWTTPQGTTIPFAQIVAPANASNPIFYRGAVTVKTNGNFVDVPVEYLPPGTNLPPIVTDRTIGALTNNLVAHTFQATDFNDGSASLLWSDFAFTGPGAAQQPTFDPLTQIFNWNPAGSQPGTYQATVRATDPHGAFDDGTLTINLSTFTNVPPVVTDQTIQAFSNNLVAHTFQATDPNDGSASLLWSDFAFSGPGAAFQPTFNAQSHRLDWNPVGSQPGTYQATVRATDPHGAFDDGTLTINLSNSTNLPPVVTDRTVGASVNNLVVHTFQATDLDDPSSSLLWSEVAFTGPGAALQPTFDPLLHRFDWITAGSQPGTYQATVRATDPHGGFDDGTLTINLSSAPIIPSIVLSTTEVPTPGLPGFKTITITVTSDQGLTAVDFAGNGANTGPNAKGFFGAMNQVNPLGQPTIFQDSNAFIPFVGANVAQDSQFNVESNAVVVPPGLAEEGPNLLQAAWAWSTPQTTPISIAQLVVPIAASGTVFYRGALTFLINGVQTDFDFSGTIGAPVIPEPATLSLVGLALVVFSCPRRRARSHSSPIEN